MKKSPNIIALENLYASIGNKWVQQNSLVLNYARASRLALGGSIGMAIARKTPKKIPGDLDFFTSSNKDAMEFITKVMNYLYDKTGSHYRLYVNNQTEFTLDGVHSHYRLVVPPYWLPICVMVLYKPIRTYLWNKMPVQFYDDVVVAARHATTIDHKPRALWDDDIADLVEDDSIYTDSMPALPNRQISVTEEDALEEDEEEWVCFNRPLTPIKSLLYQSYMMICAE